MVISEEGLKESFAKVKQDLLRIEAQMMELSGKQAEILMTLQEIEEKPKKKSRKKK